MPVDLEDLTEQMWGRWSARRGRLDPGLLLYVVWDPVGVADTPEAYDEYEVYAARERPALGGGPGGLRGPAGIGGAVGAAVQPNRSSIPLDLSSSPG
jgi:hypothetical protein